MEKNLKTYSEKSVVNWYVKLRDILPAEQKVFAQHEETLRTGTVLDIGIGGGRTTAYLLHRCKNYIGIDYSKDFVEAVKAQYPQASCQVMDARDLSAFGNNTFDFVNFSFNGMDYVDLEGRVKILSEIARVLKPGSTFFFSTHNKAHHSFNVHPWLNKDNSSFINLKTFVKLLPFLPKKIMRQKYESVHTDYAIINDSAHTYGLMTFYTSPGLLKQQLEDAGFGEIVLYTKNGAPSADSALDDWIFATAKKISA